MKPYTSSCDIKRKRAISLIEAVLYLVIALAIIIGGTVFFQQASFNRQVNATAGMMTSVSSYIVARTRETSETRSDPDFESGDATNWAIKSGAVQIDMIDGIEGSVQSEGIRLPWGGLVTFYEAASTSNGNRFPVIAARINDLPPSACMKLGQKNEVGDSMIGGSILALGVEENDYHDDNPNWTTGGILYMAAINEKTDMVALAEACKGGKRDIVAYYQVYGIPDYVAPIGSAGGDSDVNIKEPGDGAPFPCDMPTNPPYTVSHPDDDDWADSSLDGVTCFWVEDNN